MRTPISGFYTTEKAVPMPSPLNKKLLLLLIIFLQLACGQKKEEQGKLISSTALKKDFDILRKTLEEAHPGLYWYNSKPVMDAYFDSVKTTINHDMTDVSFFKLLLPLIAKIRCVHTNLRLPENADTADQFRHLLPFDFFCRDRKLYIQKCLNDKGYEGLNVLSINNITSEKILDTLLKCIPADGDNETFKYFLLSKGAFKEGCALFFGQPEYFEIKAVDSSRHLHSFKVQAIAPKRNTDTLLPPLALRFQQNTAVLSVNTFEVNTHQFQDSLEALFTIIHQKGAKHLLIDLRQNGGGANDNVSMLYSFIAVAPFQHLKRAEMIAHTLTYSSFIQNAASVEKSSKSIDGTGSYTVNDRYAGTKIKNPVSQNLFTGNVVVLTCGNTTSAASEFAALVHYLQRGKIVGEETGGCYYGATGGNYLHLQLPNSGLQIRIPAIRIFTAVAEDFEHQPKGRGTLPDYMISPTITDIINQRDVQLQKALAIFESGGR